MDWLYLLIVVVVIAVIIGAGLRNADQSYTIGSGLFKSSDNNLEKDKKLDPSDYNYYNNKDKLK